jgi:selenocysteine-specific elongation factor
MISDLILGTAGHIDHGKTALIRALTGTDTDRLPEEKKRGITIELGYAQLDIPPFRLGIVDVPGHERFVRNMLSGATGMDMAMLVIAADDSVNQQTREHLDILRMLRLKQGLIVITKSDLVEEEWLELIGEEARQLCAGTFLEDAPLLYTSAHTGQGIDELRDQLLVSAQQVAEQLSEDVLMGPFRLAVDRVFTMTGHGTVVTGSVTSGKAAVGDSLILEPGDQEVRVRGLQNHDSAVEEIHRGQRAAINLAGVHHDEIQRGQELASPGHLQSDTLITARLQLLDSVQRPLKDRSALRLHMGTAEINATIKLLAADQLAAGESAMVQFYLREPAVSVWGQPYVVRTESPMLTIGGGTILDPAAQKLRIVDDEVLEQVAQLDSDEPLQRLAAACFLAGLQEVTAGQLPSRIGVADPQLLDQLVEAGTLWQLKVTASRSQRVHLRAIDRLWQRFDSLLQKMHDAEPLRTRFPLDSFLSRFDYLDNDVILRAMLGRFADQDRIELDQRTIGLKGRGPRLSRKEQTLLRELIEQYRSAGIEAPMVKQQVESARHLQDKVPQLISLAALNGDLVQVSDDYFLHTEAEQQIKETLASAMSDGSGRPMGEIRDILQTSRRYAVPLCEYLDRVDFTRRDGDLRFLNSPTTLDECPPAAEDEGEAS